MAQSDGLARWVRHTAVPNPFTDTMSIGAVCDPNTGTAFLVNGSLTRNLDLAFIELALLVGLA